MKFTVKREKLAKIINSIAGAVPTRALFPSDSYFLVEANTSGKAALTVSGAEIRVKMILDATVEEPGSVTLPAKKLQFLCGNFLGEDVTIETVDGRAKVTCGSGHFRLAGIPVDEFPLPWNKNYEHVARTTGAVFRSAVLHVTYAASSNDARVALTGVLFEAEGDKLTCVATDGKCMAVRESKLVDAVAEKFSAIVRVRNLSDIVKIVEHDVTIKEGDGYIGFFGDTYEVEVKAIDKKYPDYKGVLPSAVKATARIPRDLFRKTLNTMKVLADTDTGTSPVELEFTENKLTLRTGSSSVGEGEDSMDIVYTGEPAALSFNPDFLIAPLALMGEELIDFNFTTAPAISITEEGFTYVAMPLKKKSNG